MPTTQNTIAFRRCIPMTTLLLALSGCGGLARIDHRIDNLTLDRSALLGTEAATPDRRFRIGPVEDVERSAQYTRQPPTRNPDTRDLFYVQADAARLEAQAVEARLDRYYSESLGIPLESIGYREDMATEDLPPPPPIPDNVLVLDLSAVLAQSQRTAREFLDAQEDYILSAIGLLRERHLWGPRLFNDTTVQVSGRGDQGTFDSALAIINELRLTQRLPSGGDVAARWIVNATEQLRSAATEDYRQSSELVFDASLPLLRGAGSVARDDLIQAERNLVYAARAFEDFRRDFVVNIASTYFGLLQQAASIRNQQEQLRNLRQTLERQRARQQAGEIALFEISITESQVLSTSNSLQSSYERYVLALDSFKIRLGLDPSTPVALAPLDLELNDPVATPTEAAQLALLYRLDLQTTRDRVLDARRAVANSRNNLLPDLNATAQVGLPTDPNQDQAGLAFDPDSLRYQAGLRFSLPLDRETERLSLRSNQIALERALRNFERSRDQVVVEARSRLRNIEVARFQLILAERQVQINELRLEEQRIREDEITPQQLVDTLAELLNARNARDAAVTDLRVAILQYLRDTGQLRIGRDGEVLPLPGMNTISGPNNP
ncbi:MAG: TolC family protein [Phycisphaeraceae bacterium]|nr:TolC family protein [Phycisphaeraceae bacterium]